MKKDKIGVKVVPDIRRSKEGEKLPLKLRVTYKGRRKYYGVGHDASQGEWEIINSNDAKGGLRKIKLEVAILENDAQKCCEAIIPFSFRQFEREFFDQKIIFQTLKSAYEAYIGELQKNNQYGTATSYRTAMNALHHFKPNLIFDDICIEFLQKFENWMLQNGKSITTVGIYVRTLRAIMNLARENGSIRAEMYPFGRRKYIIPTGKNIKKALNIEQIRQVFDYPTEPGSPHEKAKEFWIFSYLCNGINVMDIAHLRWCDVDEEKISFERAKTKRIKRGSPVKIIALRNNHLDTLIKKWGCKNYGNNNALLFDIIHEYDSPEIARKKVQQFTKVTNKWMKRIGEELGFNLKLTTYVARHSFATILVRGGAPLEFASQTLGHANILTTQKYFAGFDLKMQAEYTKALTAF